MKNVIKKLFLKTLKLNLTIEELDQYKVWQNYHNFAEPFPHFVKKTVFETFSSKDTIWVETGTHVGQTAAYLSKISKFVYTMEPSIKYYEYSKKILSEENNCKIYHGTSQDYLEQILTEIEDGSSVNFWLDGHWSGGDTFKGDTDTPINEELNIISSFVNKFSNIAVLVDDVRLFDKNFEKKDEVYPEKETLIGWADLHNLNWKISRDIFIAYN